MKISFVCVNYNNYDVTVNFVNSILQLNDFEKYVQKIVIVDNCSDLSDYENLEQYLKNTQKLVIIRSEENLGYFGGLNLGIDYISSHYEKHPICICNNDIIFDKFFVTNYFKNKYKNDDFMIVPDIKTINGQHQNPQYIQPLSKKRIMGYDIYFCNYFISILIDKLLEKKRKNKVNEGYRNSQYIHLCTGACMILRESFLNNCKRLDDRVFMWGEEAVLSAQIRKYHGFTYYDKSLKVLHLENTSVRKISNKSRYKMIKKSYRIYRDYL